MIASDRECPAHGMLCADAYCAARDGARAPAWYPRTVRFMRAVLRAGGSRLVSQRSKFRTLARDLHRLGMLELASYAGGVAHYRATARGRAEFADSHQVGTTAG